MAKVLLMLCALSFVAPTVFAEDIFSSSANLVVQELKYDPYPVEAGKYVQLWIKLDNYGADEAEKVTCELLPKYPFSLDSSENATQVIGRLPGLESVILDYRIYVDPSAVEGENELEIKCRSNDYSGWITREIKLYVTSNVPEFAVGSITSQPAKLLPDTEDNQLTVELNNIGTGDAELVSARLILPEGITPTDSYSDVDSLGRIFEGATSDAVFYVDVDKNVAPGIHNATLVLSYRESSGSRAEYKNQTLDMGLNVKSAPLFEIVAITSEPEVLSGGVSAQIKVEIKNVGFEDAESVSMKIYKKDDQPFDFDEKYDYIGLLEPGESGEAVFKVTVDEDANQKQHLLEGEIRYVVGDSVFVVSEQIPLTVVEGSAESNNVWLFVLLAALVLAGAKLYHGRKKKK